MLAKSGYKSHNDTMSTQTQSLAVIFAEKPIILSLTLIQVAESTVFRATAGKIPTVRSLVVFAHAHANLYNTKK